MAVQEQLSLRAEKLENSNLDQGKCDGIQLLDTCKCITGRKCK